MTKDQMRAIAKDPAATAAELGQVFAYVRKHVNEELSNVQFYESIPDDEWSGVVADVSWVLEDLARNPSITPKMASWLMAVYPGPLGDNPALSLWLLEDPNFIKERLDKAAYTYLRENLGYELEAFFHGTEMSKINPVVRTYRMKWDRPDSWHRQEEFANGQVVDYYDNSSFFNAELYDNLRAYWAHHAEDDSPSFDEWLTELSVTEAEQVGSYRIPVFSEKTSELSREQQLKYASYFWVNPELIRRNDAYQLTWGMILMEHPDLAQINPIVAASNALRFVADDEGLQVEALTTRIMLALAPAIIAYVKARSFAMRKGDVENTLVALTSAFYGGAPTDALSNKLNQDVVEQIVVNDSKPTESYDEVNRALHVLQWISYTASRGMRSQALARLLQNLFAKDAPVEIQDSFKNILFQQAMKGMS